MTRVWQGLIAAAWAVAAWACAPAGPSAPASAAPLESPRRDAQPAPPASAVALVVGTSGDYPPFSELRGEQVEGFSGALLEAFAHDHGRPLTWVRFAWPALVADLRAGRFAVAESGITVRPERSVEGRFTVPVARTGAVLLVRRPPWASRARLEELDRPELRLAVNAGGHLERVARKTFSHAHVMAIADNARVREALVRGEADAALTNSVEAPRWLAGTSGIEPLGPFTFDLAAVLVRAEDAKLATELDTWLLAQEASGALAALRARYLGPACVERTAEPLPALLAATAERLALMPFVAAAKRLTGKAVEDPAQEARVLAAAVADVRAAATDHRTEAPAEGRVVEFFRAQMDAAKAIQARSDSPAPPRAYSLENDLRPAIARINARMTWLLVRLPKSIEAAAVRELAREYLAGTALAPAASDRIADAIVGLAASGSVARYPPRDLSQRSLP